jgi:crotonobetainyl-CoA:carnitine CoA-transferase CaiB-like acyl-CoA transferase
MRQPSWPTSEANLERPLSGVRVLDVSRVLAGPLCTMVLADLGADVVKIEPPRGDETRRWGPPFHMDSAAYYYAANRNKWGVSLDLKDAHDRRVFDELVGAADVVVQNFPRDVAVRLGTDYESVAAANPRVVHLTVSGFGPEEPDRRGYDVIVQALGGIMAVTGEAGGPPVKVGFPICDIATGLYGTIAVLGALRTRDRTGSAQQVEVSLYDSSVSLLTNQAMNWLLCGEEPTRLGGDHPNVTPYGTYPTKDGFIVVAAGTEDQFLALVGCLELDDLLTDPRFTTNANRIGHRDELRALLTSAFAGRTTEDWHASLAAAGVPSATVRDVSAALSAPEARTVTTVTHPDYGDIAQLMTPILVNGSYLEPYLAPPRLGEHNGLVGHE